MVEFYPLNFKVNVLLSVGSCPLSVSATVLLIRVVALAFCVATALSSRGRSSTLTSRFADSFGASRMRAFRRRKQRSNADFTKACLKQVFHYELTNAFSPAVSLRMVSVSIATQPYSPQDSVFDGLHYVIRSIDQLHLFVSLF